MIRQLELAGTARLSLLKRSRHPHHGSICTLPCFLNRREAPADPNFASCSRSSLNVRTLATQSHCTDMTATNSGGIRTGSCLCQSIKYTVTGEPLTFRVCHCVNCKKASGSAFMTNAFYKDEVDSYNWNCIFVRVADACLDLAERYNNPRLRPTKDIPGRSNSKWLPYASIFLLRMWVESIHATGRQGFDRDGPEDYLIRVLGP